MTSGELRESGMVGVSCFRATTQWNRFVTDLRKYFTVTDKYVEIFHTNSVVFTCSLHAPTMVERWCTCGYRSSHSAIADQAAECGELLLGDDVVHAIHDTD